MNNLPHKYIVLANGADGPKGISPNLRLNYLQGMNDHLLNLGLPKFVKNVNHLPPRILDLLEIAGYVFAADRSILRGQKDAVEYHAWSRSIHFHIRVRDHKFWSQSQTGEALSQVLKFMTGDVEHNFSFEPGHSTPPIDLFDRPGFALTPSTDVHVTLFSGGIDSLCGALKLLKGDNATVILVSHQSQTGTMHTQKALVEALKEKFPKRVLHYPFECTLRKKRAREETQRTRSFLYTSIAYAIASAYNKNMLNVYENGITSINLHRREDLANARASRTTHPQTMGRMAHLLSLIDEKPFAINLPFLYCTKADVIKKLHNLNSNLLSSTVSCTRTFQTDGQATHCGKCFQCIDRRIAAHAADSENLDHRGLYTCDVITDKVDDREAKTTLVDYVRQAISFSEDTASRFEDEYLGDLSELLDYVDKGATDAEKIHELWILFHNHGLQVKKAIEKIRNIYEDLSKQLPANSLLDIVSSREYLKPEQKRLADNIASILSPALGDMFANDKPKDEPDFNKKLGALLRTHISHLQSEHPTVSFSCAQVVPDHQWSENGVLVEAKYIRKSSSPSKSTEGIAADLTKYPENSFILFVVYDPYHKIPIDKLFINEIEEKGRNRVLIIR